MCVEIERDRERERESIRSLIAAIMPFRYHHFFHLFFTFSTFHTMSVPLHHAVHSGFAFCDHHHSVTPLPERIGFGGSVALTVGRHMVGIAIRVKSRVQIPNTTDTFSCLGDVQTHNAY
jgi:hypothetical protein